MPQILAALLEIDRSVELCRAWPFINPASARRVGRGTKQRRDGMINTLVHERTHLVEPTPGAGQWTPWFDENLLVAPLSETVPKLSETAASLKPVR